MIRPALTPAVREHLALVRAYLHPAQVVQSTPCPVPGCGETAAPTWPAGDDRRCAPAFEPLCARHREVAQVAVLRADCTEREALAVAVAAGTLHPWPLPAAPTLSDGQRVQRAVAWKARMEVPVRKPGSAAAARAQTSIRNRCGLCGREGHNRRGCPRANGAAR